MKPLAEKPLTDHERRILEAMDLGEPHFAEHFVKKGFKRGVHEETMRRLSGLGFVKIAAIPAEGHEIDWRRTGNYYSVYIKIRELAAWCYTI